MKREATQGQATFPITGPLGRRILVPATPAEDAPAFDGLRDPGGVRAHLAREGYAVVRGLVPAATLDAAIAAFEAEVKPSDRAFMRHASGRMETHVFTPAGHMLYPIMNPHDLPPDQFGGFVRHGLEVAANERVGALFEEIFGEPGKLTHTMFFDGNQVTWAHHDSYYVDSTEIGKMIGLWIAAEDIHPGAGRFYVCPRSHRVRPLVMGRDFDDPNGDAYKRLVLATMRAERLEVYAPALRKGDALLFTSLTIHGSLPTTHPERSRRSFTGHYVPRSHAFWSFHRKVYDLPVRRVNGLDVCFRPAA